MKGCQQKRWNDRAAFTILEIMIAIGILAFGVVAVLGLFTSAVQQFKGVVTSTDMSLLAEWALSDAQSRLDQPGTPPADTGWEINNDYPQFSYKIDFESTGLEGEYKVQVLIGYGQERVTTDPDQRFQYREEFHTILLEQD